MSFSTSTDGFGLWELLMFVALGFEAAFATCAFLYTRRLLRLGAIAGVDDINGYQKALRKLGRNEPMTFDEANLAGRIIDIRRSPMAFSIPAAFMTIGIFYIFASLEYLHGHTASERTFLGIIPMFTSLNLIVQLLKTARLKNRLAKVRIVEQDEVFKPGDVSAAQANQQ